MKSNINVRYVIFLAATAALGGLLFGFDIGIITGAGPFLTEHFRLSDLSLGWAFSSLLFGCILGSTVARRLTDFYGRKKIYQLFLAWHRTCELALDVHHRRISLGALLRNAASRA